MVHDRFSLALSPALSSYFPYLLNITHIKFFLPHQEVLYHTPV
jgi:hypothetical protein